MDIIQAWNTAVKAFREALEEEERTGEECETYANPKEFRAFVTLENAGLLFPYRIGYGE